jgi:DNA-binding transcriptional regulator YhcF (GntR family)
MSRLMLELAASELEFTQTAMLFIGRGTPEEKTVATRRDLAAHLGMAHETLTRTFKKLEEEKIIRVVTDGVDLLHV